MVIKGDIYCAATVMAENIWRCAAAADVPVSREAGELLSKAVQGGLGTSEFQMLQKLHTRYTSLAFQPEPVRARAMHP